MRTAITPREVHIGKVVRDALVFNFKHPPGGTVSDSALLDAVARLFTLLEERRIDYLLVGGIALLQYVEGRNTEDRPLRPGAPVRPILTLLLAVLLSGCAMIDSMSGVSEAKRLQETGRPATARILKIWDTGITVNDDPVIGMEVEIAHEDGSLYTATIPKSLISRLDIPRFQPGLPVDVRIDPQDPAKVAIDVYKYR